MSQCRVPDCAAPTDVFLCEPHTVELEAAFGDLPALVTDLVNSIARQTRVYRTARPATVTDEDWRGGDEALEAFAEPANLAAGDLLDEARNTLTTWARHIAGTRGVELAPIPEPLGPVCARHQHDYRPAGCGHHPEQCKQMHPGHVHDMRLKGCGLETDEETGEPTCTLLHCQHGSCRAIRAAQYTGVAAQLASWFIQRRDSIRLDEAAGELHGDITGLQRRLLRAVDRSPSRLYAGPCHADVEHVISEEHDGTVYTRRMPRCQRDLYAAANAKMIVCDGWRGDGEGCRSVHSWGSRKKWLQGEVEDALLPLSELIAAMPDIFPHLPKPPKTVVQAWVRQGRLIAQTVTAGGIELYRGGDLVDLVRQYRPKTFAPRPGRKRATA